MSNDITWAELGGDAYNLATRACLEAMSVFIQIPWFLFFEKTLTSTVKGMWKMLFSVKVVCTGAGASLIAAGKSFMDGTKMALTNPVLGTVVRDTLLQNTTKVHTEVHNSTNTDDAETNKATEELATVITSWFTKQFPGTEKFVGPVILWILRMLVKLGLKCLKPKQQAVAVPPQQVETKQVKQEKKTTRRGRAKSPRR